MNPERWRRVGELFHDALDVTDDARTAWARAASADDSELRGELLSLLENDRAAAKGVLGSKVQAAYASMFDASAAEEQPRLGPYRLLRELGRGGMGTVYLAKRDDQQYEQEVAIKLVRQGMDTEIILHRFRRERQILAQFQHPNIERLLDGGTTPDGRPYIVMEYIEGSRITDYCKERGLGISEKLRLFLDVCSAVEYAHRHFVVHRDLKPGNIMVSSSRTVKLLDFGICKLLYGQPSPADTVANTLPMLTPEYASPEQVRGDPITIASDIYSLSAVLYELLTGYKPHVIENLTPIGLERAICEHEVIRPSLVPDAQLARSLKGDLDNILMQGLQKDPERRYSSVERLSDDITRYLSHQPVRACPDRLAYRIRKFVRRRRNLLVVGGLVAASLIAGLVVSLREANEANANLVEARRLADVFVFAVHDAVRDLPGSTRARQLIVETGLRFLDRQARDSRRDWALKTELAIAYQRIADVQGNVMGANLGDTKNALVSYGKAMTLLESVLNHDPSDRNAQMARLTVLQRIGSVYVYTQDSARALVSLGEAQKLGEEILSRNPGDAHAAGGLAGVYTATGDALWVAGAFADSIEQHSKAVALLLKFSAPASSDGDLKKTLAAAYSAIGMDETRLGRLEEGLEHNREALALLSELTAQNPANASYQRALMSLYSHLGDVLGNPKWRSLGDTQGALEAYQQMLAIGRRLYNTDPANQQAASDYAIALTRVAAVTPQGPQKLSMLKESLRLLREIEQVNPQNVMNRWDLEHGYMLLGDALLASGQPDASAAYRESAAVAEGLLAAGMYSPVPDLAVVLERLALMAAADGDRNVALADAHRVREITGPDGPFAKGRAENVQRFLTPRGSGAIGLAYAALSRNPTSPPEVVRDDHRQATAFLNESLALWRGLQSDPAFSLLTDRRCGKWS
jgi:eukaryotic-like serine/threonine-protein kinase